MTIYELPPNVSEAYNKARDDLNARRAVFANLDNGDLVASARFWMVHCNAPKQFDPSEPVYDATFWHIIVPELLRRL